MALQSSGAISIDDIVDEFGGTSPDGLDEYYRGGTYVPDTATNSGVPTSGAISLEDFYGAAAASVEFDVSTYDATDIVDFLADASILFDTDGTITVTGSSSSPTSGTWYSGGTPTGSDWEIRATLSSGTTPSGPTLGSWHALSSSRTWSHTASSGTNSCSLSVDIRDTATSTIQDTCTVNITATATGI